MFTISVGRTTTFSATGSCDGVVAGGSASVAGGAVTAGVVSVVTDVDVGGLVVGVVVVVGRRWAVVVVRCRGRCRGRDRLVPFGARHGGGDDIGAQQHQTDEARGDAPTSGTMGNVRVAGRVERRHSC